MTATIAPMAETITRGLIIKTKFLGPTNYRGSRVTATYKRDGETTYRVTLDWSHACGSEQNHQRAAQALLNKLNADRAEFYKSLGAPEVEAGVFEIVGLGWDHDHYFFMAAQP